MGPGSRWASSTRSKPRMRARAAPRCRQIGRSRCFARTTRSSPRSFADGPREAEAIVDRVRPQASDPIASSLEAMRALAAALTGRPDDAERALAQAEALMQRERRTTNPMLDQARVWTLVARGRPHDARRSRRRRHRSRRRVRMVGDRARSHPRPGPHRRNHPGGRGPGSSRRSGRWTPGGRAASPRRGPPPRGRRPAGAGVEGVRRHRSGCSPQRRPPTPGALLAGPARRVAPPDRSSGPRNSPRPARERGPPPSSCRMS